MADHDDRRPNEDAPGAPDPPEEKIEIDPVKLQKFLREARDNQNLMMGILAGAAAAGVGAVIWAGITWKTGYQIGFMAVGVGFLVGIAIRMAGHGMDKIFGIAGAVLALLGCVAGNLLSGAFSIAEANAVSVTDVLTQLDLQMSLEILKVMFTPMDLIFYGIAVYQGYKLSFRRIGQEDLARIAKG